MTTTNITVTGMTCGHCEAAVKEELGALPGVSDVAVDLNAGGDSPVTITSEAELDAAAIRAAVDEAGYEVK
ncbi:heavy-metal-associated domain-containing protein [Brevibacterium renqingii]|uniref:heavy-metal-associated domain-containing protein n=1 Tax=Brevibacterium renqingii TaxID=2776916 RepID=UPI001AE001F1|nr:cation transporter [Brevibacterium renqingii]